MYINTDSSWILVFLLFNRKVKMILQCFCPFEYNEPTLRKDDTRKEDLNLWMTKKDKIKAFFNVGLPGYLVGRIKLLLARGVFSFFELDSQIRFTIDWRKKYFNGRKTFWNFSAFEDLESVSLGEIYIEYLCLKIHSLNMHLSMFI